MQDLEIEDRVENVFTQRPQISGHGDHGRLKCALGSVMYLAPEILEMYVFKRYFTLLDTKFFSNMIE